MIVVVVVVVCLYFGTICFNNVSIAALGARSLSGEVTRMGEDQDRSRLGI